MWDDALRNIKIVIGTHQVLLDALIHGFVHMDKIALLFLTKPITAYAAILQIRLCRTFTMQRDRNGKESFQISWG